MAVNVTLGKDPPEVQDVAASDAAAQVADFFPELAGPETIPQMSVQELKSALDLRGLECSDSTDRTQMEATLREHWEMPASAQARSGESVEGQTASKSPEEVMAMVDKLPGKLPQKLSNEKKDEYVADLQKNVAKAGIGIQVVKLQRPAKA